MFDSVLKRVKKTVAVRDGTQYNQAGESDLNLWQLRCSDDPPWSHLRTRTAGAEARLDTVADNFHVLLRSTVKAAGLDSRIQVPSVLPSVTIIAFARIHAARVEARLDKTLTAVRLCDL